MVKIRRKKLYPAFLFPFSIFPKYVEKKFENVVTGDENWVHYFEPDRKVSNKIWANKNSKRPEPNCSKRR